MTNAAGKAAGGRIGGLRAHGLHGPDVMLAPAWRGFTGRFVRQARDAAAARGETLTDLEAERRGERLRRAHMLELAGRSASSRRKKAAR